jgi:hypothetical protein
VVKRCGLQHQLPEKVELLAWNGSYWEKNKRALWNCWIYDDQTKYIALNVFYQGKTHMGGLCIQGHNKRRRSQTKYTPFTRIWGAACRVGWDWSLFYQISAKEEKNVFWPLPLLVLFHNNLTARRTCTLWPCPYLPGSCLAIQVNLWLKLLASRRGTFQL